MANITYRTTDEKKARLAEMAVEEDQSVNKLIDDLVTVALTERDSYRRFTARASRGDISLAKSILESKATD